MRNLIRIIIQFISAIINLAYGFYFLVIVGIVIAVALSAIMSSVGSFLFPPAALSAIAFQDFPIERTQLVEFSTNSDNFKRLSEREKKDQQLDWLVYAIASDRDFTADRINQSLYDLPPIRSGYNNQLANFEYGETRHLNLGNNIVAAIVPKSDVNEKRIDDLAHIADAYRKDVGQIPAKVQIFEYDLNSDGKSGKLTHTSDLQGKDLFSDKYYYYEGTISNRDDLESFTKQVKDLTYIHRQGSNLVLGGRSSIGRTSVGMSVDNIAALWQSEQKIKNSPEQYQVAGSGFSLDPAYDYQALAKDLKEFQSFLKSSKLGEDSLVKNQDIEITLLALNSIKSQDSGKDQEQKFGLYLGLIDKLTKKSKAFFQNHEMDLMAAIKKYKADASIKITEKELQSIFALKKLEFQIEKIRYGKTQHAYQTARYDGDLQGTEVGMTLFYTDLLAKLWALDYQSSTPSKVIPEFYPLTQISSKISSIYQQESQKLSATRLWFGHQDKGFQIADGGDSLLFARNSTRIYAKSANSSTPTQETTASWESASFLGWWNDRYEEVAGYEPQYEKLNQIMKWSYLVAWLEQNQSNSLEFLQDENVSHKYRFPSWAVANQEQLRFKLWDNKSNCKEFQPDSQSPVCFYDQGYKGTKTEAMPLLQSKIFKKFGEDEHFISGGVSLPNKQLFGQRNPLPKSRDIIESGLRSNINYEEGFVKTGNNGFSFKNREGITYKIIQPQSQGVVSNAIKAGEGMKLRASVAEVANLEFTSNISHAADGGITVSTVADGIPVGDFSTTKTPNGFSIGWKSRDLDAGNALALDISKSPKKVAEVLETHPNVQSAYTDGTSYYIEMKGSTQLLELTPEMGGGGKGGGIGGGGGNQPPNWHSRVGAAGDSAGSNGNNKLFWKDKNEYKLGKTRIVERTDLQMIAMEIATEGHNPTLLFHKAVAQIKEGKLNIKSLEFDPANHRWSEKIGDFHNQIADTILAKDPKFKRIQKGDAWLYVEDTPGMNNIDWNQPIESALSLSSSSKIKVYQLEGGSERLSDFGYQSKNAVLPNYEQVATGSFNQYSMPRTTTKGEEKCEDGIMQAGTCRKIYIVIETPEIEESILN